MGKCNRFTTPFLADEVSFMNAGDEILLSGVIYTARDAAHKRMTDALINGEKIALDLKGAVLFYAGPSPARPGEPVGSIGPTTSYRMDPYTPLLLQRGVKGMIGKGDRSAEVVESMKQNGAVYLGATGGIAALLARTIITSKVLDYEDLGPEALRELQIRDMPLVVLIDSSGNSIYRTGPERFRKKT
jgi:fumarate hydratase subunit beta